MMTLGGSQHSIKNSYKQNYSYPPPPQAQDQPSSGVNHYPSSMPGGRVRSSQPRRVGMPQISAGRLFKRAGRRHQ